MDNLCSSNVLDTDNETTDSINTDNVTETIFSGSGFFEEYIPTSCVYCMISSAEQQDMQLYLDRQKCRLDRFNLHNYLLKIKFAKQEAKEHNQNKQIVQLESEIKRIGDEINELENKLNEQNTTVASISNDKISNLSSELTTEVLSSSSADKNKSTPLESTRPSVPVIPDVLAKENMNHSFSIAQRLRLIVQGARNEARTVTTISNI